ncbi:hypothetical protein DL98DRAFT_11052 [Cadophora sp. DSE1049]|nr:hypothetical protein DL98DRAFT_11052 [Cadophora sp. DSE1049]
MESVTELVNHIPPALSTSNTTTPGSTSEPTTPKDSPKVEPVNLPTINTGFELESTKPKTKIETKVENTAPAPAPAVNSLVARPTLPHANTDTVFEVAKEVQRVERRWRGMYDRNRAANPGATREPEK